MQAGIECVSRVLLWLLLLLGVENCGRRAVQ